MPEFYNNSVFWIEVNKIKPNPFQPRREFDEHKLKALADSIRQYGILQPLVVLRQEVEQPDGGLVVEYELVAGERRWRASQLAGFVRVPAVIRDGAQDDHLKLEMAIIENLQREDLNPVERAKAFHQLANEFKLKHHDIAKRVGKSREYVSNTIRMMMLPEPILNALSEGKINEGHTRPILMLVDHPEEQTALFQEILVKKLNVRETESIARRIAFERVRRKTTFMEPEIVELEQRVSEKLGTRVRVEKKETGGKVTIDFFSTDDLRKILGMLSQEEQAAMTGMEVPVVASSGGEDSPIPELDAETAEEDPDIYNIKNFSI
jgi:ParB family chromosome partitioning protein